MARRVGGIKGYCSMCRVSCTNVASHMATATHRRKAHAGSDMSKVSMRDRPVWMQGRKPEDYISDEMAEDAAQALADMSAPAPEPEWLGVAILAGVMVPPDPGDGTILAALPPEEEPIEKIKIPARVERPAAPAPRPRPVRGHRPDPCQRCGRADFATDKGRTWHLENNPGCAKSRRPDKYQYISIGG